MFHQLLEEGLNSLPINSNIRKIFDEMIENFYPEVSKVNPRIAFDLALLYIFRQLDNEEEKEELLNFWRNNSPPRTFQLPMGEFHYRPSVDFIHLDKIMNGLYIEKALEQLSKFDHLSFYESCAILFDLERYYVVPLSEMDVKIIETIREAISKNSPYNNELLSMKLKVRANYISRRMSYLRNNAYFRITGTVNFPCIGLNQYIILIESSPESRGSLSNYFTSPFTRTIRRCPNQRFDYIISLTIPKRLENNLFEYLIKLDESSQIRRFYCDEVTAISNNLSFYYYSYSKRPTVLSGSKPGFFIDWFKERILGFSNKNSLTENDPYHRFYLQGTPVDLTVLDLKIMNLIRRDLDSSVRYVAKRLSLSWDEANSHLPKIKELLFPMILLYYTGLNQTALLFFEKISATQIHSLEFALSRMPQVFSYYFRNGGAIFTIDLMDGAHRLNDLIWTLPEVKGAQFSLLSKITGGIFRSIPYGFFNELENDWIFPEDFFLFNELK